MYDVIAKIVNYVNFQFKLYFFTEWSILTDPGKKQACKQLNQRQVKMSTEDLISINFRNKDQLLQRLTNNWIIYFFTIKKQI